MIGINQSLLQRPRALLVYLIALDLFFVIMFPLSSGSGSLTLAWWFDLDSENSIPTWYSSSQWLVSGLLVLLTSSFRTRDVRPTRAFCILVGLGLVFLSADEASMIHERLTPLAASHAEFIPMFRGDRGAWISIYGAIALLLAVLNFRNILSLWQHHRRATVVFCTGFATLVTGAVVIEAAGYYSLFASDTLQLMAEEGLEMVGGSIILVGTALFLNSHISLQPTVFTGGPPAA